MSQKMKVVLLLIGALTILSLLLSSNVSESSRMDLRKFYRDPCLMQDRDALENLNLNPYFPPLGKFDGTGFNYILINENGDSIGVVVDKDHSITGEVETLIFAELKSLYEEEIKALRKFFNRPVKKEELKAMYHEQVDYINKFMKIAIEEEIRTGIPAYIKLSQGIIESRFGTSKLSRQTGNHFGIKCHQAEADRKKGRWHDPTHCYQHHDDDPWDRFLVFKNPEQSWEYHSRFLTTQARYKHLFNLDRDDYIHWTRYLGPKEIILHGKKVKNPKGTTYATEPNYPQMLRQIIKRFRLVEITKEAKLAYLELANS